MYSGWFRNQDPGEEVEKVSLPQRTAMTNWASNVISRNKERDEGAVRQKLISHIQDRLLHEAGEASKNIPSGSDLPAYSAAMSIWLAICYYSRHLHLTTLVHVRQWADRHCYGRIPLSDKSLADPKYGPPEVGLRE